MIKSANPTLKRLETVTPTLLDERYSTTRLITWEEPVIEKHPDDKFETVLFLPPVEGRKGEGGLRTQGYFKQSLPDKPLITIITVVFNGAEHLEQTILSVINQNYDNVEYIIIDGGSTDGTLDIIKKYESAVDYWVSEPDEGIYHAMNKGIILTSGFAVGLINSGDSYLENAILSLIERLRCKCGEDGCIYYGDSIYIDMSKKDVKSTYLVKGDLKRLPVTMSICHQSTFIPHKVYSKYGLYNTDYKYASDYEYLFSLLLQKTNFYYLESPICYFMTGGISDKKIIDSRLETLKVHLEVKSNLILQIKVFLNVIKQLAYYQFVKYARGS